jgi:predicted RecA/RadA family phage recombinase
MCAAVSLSAIAAGNVTAQYGDVETAGVFNLAKTTSQVWTQGEAIYWDTATGKATNVVASGVWFLGFADVDAASAAEYGEVALAPYASEGPRTVSVTETGSVAASDFYGGELIVQADTTGGAVTLTLPAVADVPTGAKLTVVLVGGGGTAITLDGNASETVGGGATFATIDADDDTATFVNSGTAWVLVSSVIA